MKIEKNVVSIYIRWFLRFNYSFVEWNFTRTENFEASFIDQKEIEFYRFKTIDTFSCYGLSPDKFYGSFVFNDLKRLSSSSPKDSSNLSWMNLTLHMTNLKILETRCKIFIKKLQFLLSELSELELITIQKTWKQSVDPNTWQPMETNTNGKKRTLFSWSFWRYL